MFTVQDKVALITGGASGIGLCYAKELLKNGLKGVTLADINETFGKSAVQELEKEFGDKRVLFIKTDVTNKQQFEDEFGALPVYTATKHAVVGLSRSFGTEQHYKRTKVKVLTMCPGVTNTPLVDFSGDQEKSLGPEYTKLIAIEIAALAIQPPEHVAKAMVHIIKEGKTGSVWVAEGEKPPYEVDFPRREERRKQ